jgi:drug/metabolite transporter (DMT)-like permease
MNKFLNHPLYLLLSTGVLLGLYFPIGKAVASAGLSPAVWAIVISLVPGLTLLLASLWHGGLWNLSLMPFGLIAGLTAYAIPNTLSFAAIPHVGSGYVALMFAVSPVFTAMLSLLFNIRPPNRQLLISVALGFAGALLIILFRQQLHLGADGPWPLLAFLVPLSLAAGNVYRTAFWPSGASPTTVGAAANLGAIPFLLVTVVVNGGAGDLAGIISHATLTIAQIVISLVMFLVFFRLQVVGGPTYLSQIGYVAAAIGLGIGSLYFGESYPWPVWLGAAAIAGAVVVSNWKTN